jgi:hypothetical protein
MFGDRWRFGIECELQKSEVDPWGSREPFGSVWFWTAGQVVGNPEKTEQLIHAFTPIDRVLSANGNRSAAKVPGFSLIEKFEFISWLNFGEDEEFDSIRWGSQDISQLRQWDVTRFQIMPGSYSPFHDGWEAVLFENFDQETLLWLRSEQTLNRTYTLILPRAEFARVLTSASDWFNELRRARHML